MSICLLDVDRMCMIYIKGNIVEDCSTRFMWITEVLYLLFVCFNASDPEREGPSLSRSKFYKMWMDRLPYLKVKQTHFSEKIFASPYKHFKRRHLPVISSLPVHRLERFTDLRCVQSAWILMMK
jgi:hypothetical protein